MPVGWTRLIFKNFEFPYVDGTIDGGPNDIYGADINAGNLNARFDVIVFNNTGLAGGGRGGRGGGGAAAGGRGGRGGVTTSGGSGDTRRVRSSPCRRNIRSAKPRSTRRGRPPCSSSSKMAAR
jgi:hypothetical protein